MATSTTKPLSDISGISDGNMAADRIECMCGNKPWGRGRDRREELADLQDQGDLGVRVVQHLQVRLDCREVQGVPWVHHVREGQLVLQEDPVIQQRQGDRLLLVVP